MKETAQQVKSVDFKAKKANRNEETSAKSQRIMIFKFGWEKMHGREPVLKWKESRRNEQLKLFYSFVNVQGGKMDMGYIDL